MLHASIGVIGQGFVGKAVADAFRTVSALTVETYDKFIQEKSTMSLVELVAACQFIFVCVPTPMNDDGSCDTSIVEDVVAEIAMHMDSTDNTRIVIIKSTIPPGTTDMLNRRHAKDGLEVIFNPEFLNARSAYDDFITQDHVVLGGDPAACTKVAQLFRQFLPSSKMCVTDAKTAETIKYVKNCFFATKVSFANEMYQICQKLNVDYTKMIDIAQNDSRMGWEHWKVPGPTPSPDGKLKPGFSNVCLPKDLQAFVMIAQSLGIDPKVMCAAWEKNLEVRPERDWELLAGVKSIK